TAHAAEEVAHVGFGEGVLQREHRTRMADLGEAAGDWRADGRTRAVGTREVGKASLELAVAPDESVEFGVGDLRCVLLMIELVVVGDLSGERGQLLLRLDLAQGLDRLVAQAGLLGRLPAVPPAAISRSAAARPPSL